MKRVIAISGFLALAVLLGAAYPMLARGPELGGAEWQYPWYLLALLLVPWAVRHQVLRMGKRLYHGTASHARGSAAAR